MNHANRIYLLQLFNGIVDSVLAKYVATILAFYILSRPVFGDHSNKKKIADGQDNDPTKIMEEYSRNCMLTLSSSGISNKSFPISRKTCIGWKRFNKICRLYGMFNDLTFFIRVEFQNCLTYWLMSRMTFITR